MRCSAMSPFKSSLIEACDIFLEVLVEVGESF